MSDDLWDLEVLAGATRLGDWMFAQFRPYVGGSVAEVGAGIGTFSQRLLETPGVTDALLMEPEPSCVHVLQERFAADPRVSITDELLPDSPVLARREGTVDFLLCQNVLEHIEDDRAAIAAMARSLRPGGTLSVLVPAHPALYGTLDRQYGHARRYTRQRLAWLAGTAGLEPLRIHSFNALGIAGWIAKNRLSPQPRLDERSIRAYEALVRYWRPLEDRLALPVGLSVVLHARMPA